MFLNNDKLQYKLPSLLRLFKNKVLVVNSTIFVKLRSRSRSGEGQVRVRKVIVKSMLVQLKGFIFKLKIWT